MLGKFAKKLSKMLRHLGQRKQEEQADVKNESTKKTTSTAYSREFYDEEDSEWNYWNDFAYGYSGYNRDRMAAKEDKTIYEKEFFVYGSLQPGNMNWDRLADETIKAERVNVPGYIRILWSGFGGFHPNPELPQSSTAKNWILPTEPPKVVPAFPVGTEYAKGWILTLRGTLKFFDMLDQFEGFTPNSRYAGSGSYERRALWINDRWMWSYPMPKDNLSLEKISEWTDSIMTKGWRSRGNSSGSRYSYASTWEDHYDLGKDYKNPYKSTTTSLALPKPKDELDEYVRLLNKEEKEKTDDLPDWVLEQRRQFDSDFSALAAGFENTEPFSLSQEEELLKGDSWQSFIEEHLAKS